MSEGYLAEVSGRRRIMVDGKPRRPCGTHAGFQYHRSHGEDPCAACTEAEQRWGRFDRAKRKLRRRRASGATSDELRELDQDLQKLQRAYRSLEQLTGTPLPPSHRYLVYRYRFETGEGYVGLTERTLEARHAEHASGNARQTGGSAEVYARIAEGIPYVLEVIEHGLNEGQARELEAAEIAKLDKPLNIQGPVKSQRI
ncbi:hypothetical protein [Candidatus Poriferisodalis sp.]|uniref:hypothetical protein n=1 Tax=Candidatus Poriferisodalis sp. TaxID=3101277 RepID=UPI003B012B5D